MLSRGRFVETGSLPVGSLNEVNVSLLLKVPSNNCHYREYFSDERCTIRTVVTNLETRRTGVLQRPHNLPQTRITTFGDQPMHFEGRVSQSCRWQANIVKVGKFRCGYATRFRGCRCLDPSQKVDRKGVIARDHLHVMAEGKHSSARPATLRGAASRGRRQCDPANDC
jgi:hypothetical protein